MGKTFAQMIMYLLDRPIFGQIQGMYYMYEYYPPSFDTLMSKFLFSSHLASGIAIPPDQYIVEYIYPFSDHVVNVNTYFIGEAWSFGGESGVLFFSLLVGLFLFLYIVFWNFFIAYETELTYLMALVFFSTLPINQSLQFIIYQKYFLYFMIFFAIPLLFLNLIFKWKRQI